MKKGGLILWNAIAICKIQDLLADGKTPCETRFREPFQDPIIPSGAMVEYYPISVRDGKKVLLGIFPGSELIAGRTLEGRHSDCGFGRFGKMDASEI